MKEIVCPVENFEFQKFVEDLLEFGETIVDPDYVVAWVEEEGDIPDYEPGSDAASLLERLKNKEGLLFLAFSDSNVGDPISCADGKQYEIDEDSDFCMGEVDCYGYLLEYEDGNLIINSAINAGGACTAPPPSLDIELDCDLFDKPMERFIRKYIK